jgi:NADH-quinone oxidoreductase subunit H
MFALDPLLSGHIGWSELVIVLIKVVIAFAALLVAVMAMIWFERKVHADMTNRIGPNLAGPFGVFQTLADGIKFFFKEDLMPRKADRLVFRLAPYLSLIPAFLTFTVIPLGGRFDGGRTGRIKLPGFHKTTLLQVADPHFGILLVLAMSSIAVYGIMLAGWSSGSKYPLLGSVRATAQMVSYEAGLGLAVLAVLLRSGNLSTNAIVSSQSVWHWNVWMTLFVPFIVFLIAVTAEMNRPPFDLVEAEQELVGGFHTEYSSIRFALFFLSEFMNVVTMSAIIVTLFFGGPAGPSIGPSWLRAILPTVWFLVKLVVFLFIFVSFRATLPRFRYDQLMDLGWKVMIPLALGWFLLLVTVHVAHDHHWNAFATVGGLIVGLGAAGLLLRKAIRTSAARRVAAEEGVVL